MSPIRDWLVDRCAAGRSVYRYVCVVVEHRFDVIAELQRHCSGQPTGDDYVSHTKLLPPLRQPRNQPDDTRRRMSGCC